MRIISLNVGLPSAQRYEGREVITGGTKKPVPRAVLRFSNFEGDRQAEDGVVESSRPFDVGDGQADVSV